MELQETMTAQRMLPITLPRFIEIVSCYVRTAACGSGSGEVILERTRVEGLPLTEGQKRMLLPATKSGLEGQRETLVGRR